MFDITRIRSTSLALKPLCRECIKFSLPGKPIDNFVCSINLVAVTVQHQKKPISFAYLSLLKLRNKGE